MSEMTEEAVTRKTDPSNGWEPYRDMTELIRSKARELWEQRGWIQGMDLDIWLEAERMVLANQ